MTQSDRQLDGQTVNEGKRIELSYLLIKTVSLLGYTMVSYYVMVNYNIVKISKITTLKGKVKSKVK